LVSKASVTNWCSRSPMCGVESKMGFVIAGNV
jgi:hypothetical protein